jgi:hypothetical protein
MKMLLFIAFLFDVLIASAQAPQGVNYQAVIRNPNGVTINSTPVTLKLDILQGAANGAIVYTEVHTATTSAIGLVNLVLGNGTPLLGTFSAIDWANGPFYIQVSVDLNAGANYSIVGTQQFMSVPYALYAANASNPGPQGPPGNDGVGIVSTVNNGNGTFTFFYSDGSSFTTGNLTGPQGQQGAQGSIGPQGPQGQQGATGSAGTQGPIGLSAYQVAVNNGYLGTETQWLASLQGATGAQGVAGSQGIQGISGPQGIQGIAGTNGLTSLVLTSVEPIGANCPSGGVKMEYGLDANSNGVLDVSEVTASLTKYVCNGTNASLPTGSLGQTLYHNGSNWTATSNLYNSGTAIGVGTTSPNPSALVQLNSTNQGFLLPSMTQAQRDAISSPATGLLVFQTTNNPGFYYFNGTAWVGIGGSGTTSSTSGSNGNTLVFTTDGF